MLVVAVCRAHWHRRSVCPVALALSVPTSHSALGAGRHYDGKCLLCSAELPVKAGASGDDVRIEVGVLTADGTLKRNIACYDARTGFVRAVHHEIFAEQ